MIDKKTIEKIAQKNIRDFRISDETFKTLKDYQQMKKCSDEYIYQNIEKLLTDTRM